MPTVELSRVAPGCMEALTATMVTAGFVALGAPPRVYVPDTIPDQPVEPYLVGRYTQVLAWDYGLDACGQSGWAGLELTGVARLDQAAMWVLDVARSFLRTVVPATVVVAGDTHVKSISSQGPPVGPIEAGTLTNMVESYLIYVEAS